MDWYTRHDREWLDGGWLNTLSLRIVAPLYMILADSLQTRIPTDHANASLLNSRLMPADRGRSWAPQPAPPVGTAALCVVGLQSTVQLMQEV